MENNNNGNAAPQQITFWGKVTAGILLVLFTAGSIVILIGFWPDTLPEPGKKCALYEYKWFHMTLDTNACLAPVAQVTVVKEIRIDSNKGPLTKADSARLDSIRKAAASQTGNAVTAGFTIQEDVKEVKPVKHIHLHTILLILVAVGGFLGNMIHIATSFTTYVGAGKFQRSWILWYWVRPFTASALALALYFAFGASKDAGSVDLDRIITVAILAGLFTDIATQKLKEILVVIFNPKENRPDDLAEGPSIDKAGVLPKEWQKEGANAVSAPGKNLKSKKLAISVADTAINDATVNDTDLRFSYTLSEADKAKPSLELLVLDDTKKEILRLAIPVAGAAAEPADVNEEEEDDTDEEEEKPVG